MNDSQYRRCVRCVIDTSDPKIFFNKEGVCNHCLEFDTVTSKRWFPNEVGARKLKKLIDSVKKQNGNGDHNCIVGLSGGVDSSYLALKLFEWGLSPLVVHVDAGWNSELAVANIETIVKHCGFDLHTHVVDWGEMRDLQLAYFRSNVANQDVPQDHIFAASVYKFAVQNNIKTVFSGGNIATESIFPDAWHHAPMDVINLRAIHKRYGEKKLKSFLTVSFFEYYIKLPYINRLKVARPLNLIPYTKEGAIAELENIGWRAYGRKHGESLFTKFFQNYYLPEKHGFDKRLPHLSSLIVSGQVTREEALKELEKPLYEPLELQNDIKYFCKKLGIERSEYDEIMRSPTHHYTDFKNWDSRYHLMKRIQKLVEKLVGKSIGGYS